MVRFGAQKIWCLQHNKKAKSSQTYFLLQNGIPDPLFLQNGGLYGVNPTLSVEEMAREIIYTQFYLEVEVTVIAIAYGASPNSGGV